MYDHKNFINALIQGGVVRRSSVNNADYDLDLLRVELDFSKLDALWEQTEGDATEKAKALVDYFDFYMNAGYGARYQTEHRDILIEAVANTRDSLRNRLVTYGSYNSPEFVVQK